MIEEAREIFARWFERVGFVRHPKDTNDVSEAVLVAKSVVSGEKKEEEKGPGDRGRRGAA
jgi:hypothetical protein